MKPENRKGHIAKATPPLPAAASHEVNRALFTLPASTWAAIDLQRKNTGMSAGQYITSLVLKATK